MSKYSGKFEGPATIAGASLVSHDAYAWGASTQTGTTTNVLDIFGYSV